MSLFTLVTLVLAAPAQEASVAGLSPEKPIQGQEISVVYRPKAKGAALTTKDQMYAVVYTTATDQSGLRVPIELNQVGEEYQGSYRLSPKAARVAVYFFTKVKGDPRSGVEVMVYTPDGKPARNGYGSGFGQDYQKNFDKEMELYPDNFYAYRSKWFCASAFDKANFTKILQEDLKKLESAKVTDELLAARIFAYMNLKDEPAARASLRALVEQFPESPLVTHGFSNYDYGVFSNGVKGEGPAEAERLKIDLVKKYPTNRDFRDFVRVLSWGQKIPIETVETACKAWIAEEPKNPTPYSVLAWSYHQANRNAGEAANLYDKALDLYLAGEDRVHHDMFGQTESLVFPSAFREAAQVFARAGQWSKALGAIRTSQSIDKSMSPEAHLVEGQIWMDLGNKPKAKAAYAEAHRRGSEKASAPLKDIYLWERGNEDGFDQYMAEVGSGPTTNTSATPLAPTFSVTDLNGKKYDLNALKGKVVVLNFWFIGCAPCRVEMPALNKLVKEYASNKDVVFIAFANDPEADLREFLKKTPFDYNIVGNGGSLATKYGVAAFPGHVVIGKDGRISSQSIGGSESIDKDLRNRINRALGGS